MKKPLHLLFSIFILLPIHAFAGDLRRIQNLDNTCGAYDEWPEDYAMQFFWSGNCSEGLANGEGIAVFVEREKGNFFIFTGNIQNGYFTGEARIEWGLAPNGSPERFFSYPFFSLSKSGIIARAHFTEGTMNGLKTKITGTGYVYTQNYVNNSPIDAAVSIDAQNSLVEYSQTISYVLGFKPLGEGCNYALHLHRITQALKEGGFPMLGAVGFLGAADVTALFDCVYWNMADNPYRKEAVDALNLLNIQGSETAATALYTINRQGEGQYDESTRNYFESLTYRESDFGLDYRIMADFPVSYMLSQGEAEFMENAPPEFEDETYEDIARIWLFNMALEIGSGGVSKATEEDMREFTPNMLLSFGRLDPNDPKYGLLEAYGRGFQLDLRLGYD